MGRQRVDLHVHRGGCGCGSAFVFLLAVGLISLAGSWIGDHPIPAALIGVVALATVGGIGYELWNRRKVPQQGYVTPPAQAPAGFCPECGTPAVGGMFCRSCGASLRA